MIDKVKQGKKNRAAGGAFELRTRKDLEEKGWMVDKWSNNVEFIRDVMCKPELYFSYKCVRCGKTWGEKDIHPVCQREGKLIPAKRKYAGPGRPMAIGTGFPDFIAFKIGFTKNIHQLDGELRVDNFYEVIGVESKTNGKLDKIEKEKCRWYLDNNVFSKILISEKTKVKNRVVIVYHDFKEKYGKV